MGDVCKVLPKTYNELKAEYLSLDGQYKSFTNIMKSYRVWKGDEAVYG